jgi:tRNA-specific 2-thiouridylase
MAKKVIVLTSGGLDSILTLKLMEKAGLDIVGVHFLTWFNTPKYTLPEDFSERYYNFHGYKIRYIDISVEYTNVLVHPQYGYGSGVNPCIDCKILFFKKARELMDSLGADFVATGEVLGQRPMTQRHSIMKLIEHRSGLSGYLLRPLSAKLLEPTIPEELGWVNRDELYAISGRGRSMQMELAKEFRIEEYPSPAGGCILTEKQFKIRLKDLIEYSPTVTVNDLIVLRYGRHFRLSPECKLVIGRHRRENEVLKRIKWGDVRIEPISAPGPFCLMMWPGKISLFKMAVKVIARYSGYNRVQGTITFRVNYLNKEKSIIFKGNPDEDLCAQKIIR